MAYLTYTTDAIVCGSRNRNTTDRALWLFTREAGMVIAIARSVRDEKSKLRYALQDFSLVSVSLVRGKHDWRVTGADARANMYYTIEDRNARAVLMRTLRLLRRLLPGEEAHPVLFDMVTDSLYTSVLKKEEDLFELVLMLRILYALGYVAPNKEYEHIVRAASMNDALVSARSGVRARDMSRAVEHALTVSQL